MRGPKPPERIAIRTPCVVRIALSCSAVRHSADKDCKSMRGRKAAHDSSFSAGSDPVRRRAASLPARSETMVPASVLDRGTHTCTMTSQKS
jgi:hypothetical protein